MYDIHPYPLTKAHVCLKAQTRAHTVTSNWQMREYIAALAEEKSQVKYSWGRAGVRGGEGCCHYSAPVIWQRLYIENEQSVMSLSRV